MSPGTLAIVAVSVLLAAWYAAAHIYNRRRGRRLRSWLEDGLDALDGERTSGWIGSPAAGARINITRARSPFRRLEITMLLENREIPLLWLLDYLRGKRDRTTIRATLRSPSPGEVTVSSRGRTELQGESWTWLEGPHGLSVAYRGRSGSQLARSMRPWLEAYGTHLDRFHWRKQDPHIVLQLGIAGLVETRAETLLTDLSTSLRANRA
ncbi:MAG: hypothetical protein PVF54_00885 [Anaerolineae bacterium]|jgi:hypothetical protein